MTDTVLYCSDERVNAIAHKPASKQSPGRSYLPLSVQWAWALERLQRSMRCDAWPLCFFSSTIPVARRHVR